MKKRIWVAGLAVALAGVSASSFAADTGSFYVGADVGQAQHRLGAFSGENVDAKATAATVRLGYVWHAAVDVAVETGYVDLGKITADYGNANTDYSSHLSVRASGLFAGTNLKYHVADAWYVSARAGVFQSYVKANSRNTTPYGSSEYRRSGTYGSWYAGAGVGYDVSRDFSLGLNYTNYRSKVADSVTFNTAMFSLSAEYRF